jgi:ABC-type amino acid transport substrate-binding protein
MARRILLFVVLAALLPVRTHAAPPLRIATSHLPPLSIEDSPQRPGALVEVVRELTRRAGVKARVDFVPWQRAVFMSTHFPQTAIFPLTRTPEREAQYRWLVQLYHEQFSFVALRGRQPLGQVEALRGKRVAILRGSAQVAWLRQAGYTHVIETASVEEGLRFVQRGIADVLFGDHDITLGALRETELESRVEESAPLRTTTTWLGGSLDLPAADAARLQQAMKSMLDDGSYARIMKRYGLATQP